MNQKKLLPPVFLFSAMLLMAALHVLLPLAEIVAYPWLLLGSLPLLLGIAINLSADRAFKTFNTTVKPYEESSTLITSGVFRYTRHPMYLGMIFILLGLSILMGSLTPFFVIPAFALVMEKRFIAMEETMLAQKFGATWTDYKSKVRKWI